MKFNIIGKNIKITDDITEFAKKKISKLDRFFRAESETSVVFSSLRGRFTAEVTLSNNGMFYRVADTTGDLRASVDSAVASIERQIRKHKTRLAKRLRDNAFAPVESEPEEVVVTDEPETEEPEFRIVRSKMFPIKPMTAEEAVLQMNLLGHEFYVFKNQDHDERFSVVYKRKQGDYGMIESLEG